MNSIDTEIQQLQARITELEKTKTSVTENLDIINNILVEKKKQIRNNSYSKSVPLARFYD